MIAYRGFDDHDNLVHNLAGVAAIFVALFPKLKSKDGSDRFYSEEFFSILHGPSAVILFLLAAYAVWYGGGNMLKSHLSNTERQTLTTWKWISLLTMASGIAVYLWFLIFDRIFTAPGYVVLVIELLGFFGFAAHWIVMTVVISRANTRRANEASKGGPSGGMQARVEVPVYTDENKPYIP